MLLLDPGQVIPIAEELGKGIGLLPEEPEDIAEPDAEIEFTPEEEEDDPFFPETERAVVAALPEEEEAEDREEAAGPVASLADEETEDAEERCAAVGIAHAHPGIEQQETEPVVAEQSVPESHNKNSSVIDEETFKKVMGWTVARFKQSRTGEELHLGIEQLPPELADFVN